MEATKDILVEEMRKEMSEPIEGKLETEILQKLQEIKAQLVGGSPVTDSETSNVALAEESSLRRLLEETLFEVKLLRMSNAKNNPNDLYNSKGQGGQPEENVLFPATEKEWQDIHTEQFRSVCDSAVINSVSDSFNSHQEMLDGTSPEISLILELTNYLTSHLSEITHVDKYKHCCVAFPPAIPPQRRELSCHNNPHPDDLDIEGGITMSIYSSTSMQLRIYFRLKQNSLDVKLHIMPLDLCGQSVDLNSISRKYKRDYLHDEQRCITIDNSNPSLQCTVSLRNIRATAECLFSPRAHLKIAVWSNQEWISTDPVDHNWYIMFRELGLTRWEDSLNLRKNFVCAVLIKNDLSQALKGFVKFKKGGVYSHEKCIAPRTSSWALVLCSLLQLGEGYALYGIEGTDLSFGINLKMEEEFSFGIAFIRKDNEMEDDELMEELDGEDPASIYAYSKKADESKKVCVTTRNIKATGKWLENPRIIQIKISTIKCYSLK